MSSTITPAVSEPQLAISGLKKEFASGFVLGPLDFTLGSGATIGLVGKNGAGKTTSFQLLTGNLDATAGEIRLAGRRLTPDTAELKREVGYLPQDPVLPEWASGHEVLSYAARLYGLPHIEERVTSAEDLWDCASYKRKPLGTLSYGMQKRVGLALATLHEPAYLILDEPFSGLDLNHIKTLEGMIAGRTQRGHITILSTHVLSFCARLCTEVLILADGKWSKVAPWDALSLEAREAEIESRFFGVRSTN